MHDTKSHASGGGVFLPMKFLYPQKIYVRTLSSLYLIFKVQSFTAQAPNPGL